MSCVCSKAVSKRHLGARRSRPSSTRGLLDAGTHSDDRWYTGNSADIFFIINNEDMAHDRVRGGINVYLKPGLPQT